MFVRDILTSKGAEVVTVGPETKLREFVQILVDNRIGATVVKGPDGAVVGVISERDVIYGLANHGGDCLEMVVEDLMTTEIFVCTLDTTIDEVMSRMTTRRVRHLPVMENGELVGIVSIGDVVKRRIAEAEREASQLREYITA